MNDTTNETPSTPIRVPVRRRSWLLVSAAAALGLAVAVAADDPGLDPAVARATVDDDAAQRPLSDGLGESGVSYDDHTLDLLRRLVDGRQIPRATLE